MPGYLLSVCFVSMMLSAGLSHGQGYPNKPIRIVTGGIGSGSDFTSRLIAQRISVSLGQPVIVENRGSGGPGPVVAKASPDGYSLLATGGNLWIGPLLRPAPYDALKDFAPITLMEKSPSVLVVNPLLPVKSVHDLIALAKAKPGELNYASSSTGSAAHLSGELFNYMAGVRLIGIPYKNASSQMADLIAGEVQLAFGSAAALPHIKAGRLRALAVTSAQPSALYPGLPTVTASGLPSYESVGISGMLAPANTAPAIIASLNREIVRVLDQADVKMQLLNIGTEPAASSPEEFAATMKSEIAKWDRLIKAAGIKE